MNPVPNDPLHATMVFQHPALGFNDVVCLERPSPTADWVIVRRYQQKYAEPIEFNPDYSSDGQYIGKHPVKMPSTSDLVVGVDPRSLTDLQHGIQIGNLGDLNPVPFDFPNAPGTPGYKQ